MEGEREGGTSATWPGKMAIEQMGKNGPLKKIFSCHCFSEGSTTSVKLGVPFLFVGEVSQSKLIEAEVNAIEQQAQPWNNLPIPKESNAFSLSVSCRFMS